MTLDDQDHFTDALHVYGTNQQADQYNATMLQKLDTPKYVIQSSDITRDRDTRQVNISLNHAHPLAATPHAPPWTEFLIHASENITLPQFLTADVGSFRYVYIRQYIFRIR